MFYVIEFQTSESTAAAIPFTFDEQMDAEAKYHTLLAVAAKSNVQKHGVILINEDLFPIKKEIYVH